MKRKYLHVEIIRNRLYIYSDNKSSRGKTLRLKDMDKECGVGEIYDLYGIYNGGKGLHIHKKIPLKDFIV